MATKVNDSEERERRIELVGNYRYKTGASTRVIAKYFTDNYFEISNNTVFEYIKLYCQRHPDKKSIIEAQTKENIPETLKDSSIKLRVYEVAKLLKSGLTVEEVSEKLNVQYWIIYRDIHNRLSVLDKELYIEIQKILNINKLNNLKGSINMNQNQKQEIEKYDFLAELALEYRLSLDNLCMLLGIEKKDENKKILFDKLLNSTRQKNKDYQNIFKYLFNFETVGETNSISTISRARAKRFLDDYKNSNNSGKIKLYEQFGYLAIEYNKIKQKLNKDADYILTSEDKNIIERYRLKYALTRMYVSSDLGLLRWTFERYEKNIDDKYLKIKIEQLNDYNSNFAPHLKKSSK